MKVVRRNRLPARREIAKVQAAGQLDCQVDRCFDGRRVGEEESFSEGSEKVRDVLPLPCDGYEFAAERVNTGAYVRRSGQGDLLQTGRIDGVAAVGVGAVPRGQHADRILHSPRELRRGHPVDHGMLKDAPRAAVGGNYKLETLVVPAVEGVADVTGVDAVRTCDRAVVVKAHDEDGCLKCVQVRGVSVINGEQCLSVLGTVSISG